MKHLVITLILCLATVASSAQEVISANGDTKIAGGMEVSWTIGETLVVTHTGSTNILTQGFHQPGFSVTALHERVPSEISVSVFPNPTRDILSMQISEYVEGLRYTLLDVTGRVLENQMIYSPEVRISMSHYTKGAYILKVMDASLQDVQSFRVVRY